MTVLLTFRCEDGRSRRCTSRCYDAKNHRCRCICRGANHGIGFPSAIRQTARHARDWLTAWNRQFPNNKVLYACNDYATDIAQLTLFTHH
jgi:hypothetical protein